MTNKKQKEIEVSGEDTTRNKDQQDIVDNEFEALSQTKKIFSENPLSSDYVFAHLGQAEKDLVVETLFNSDYAQKLLKRYYKEKCIPVWDDEKMIWKKDENNMIKYFSLEDIDNKGKEVCKKNADDIFNMFMLKINSIAILNRNIDKNFMLKYGWYKIKDEEQPAVYTTEDRSAIQKVKDFVTGKQGEEYEE